MQYALAVSQEMARTTVDSAWDERMHPRDAQGQFASGSPDWKIYRNAVLGTLRRQYPPHHPPVSVTAKNGDNIMISYAGLKHALHKGMPKPEKTLLSLHLRELISNAIKTSTFPDKHDRKDPASVTHYATGVMIDGNEFDVDIVVRNHLDGNRYYDHFAVKEKAHQGYPESGTDIIQNSPARPFSGLHLSMKQINGLVKHEHP